MSLEGFRERSNTKTVGRLRQWGSNRLRCTPSEEEWGAVFGLKEVMFESGEGARRVILILSVALRKFLKASLLTLKVMLMWVSVTMAAAGQSVTRPLFCNPFRSRVRAPA